MLEEERDRLKEAVNMVEETMITKRKLENSIKKADVADKEKERDLSSKRAKLKK